jgi:hypothetical protein
MSVWPFMVIDVLKENGKETLFVRYQNQIDVAVTHGAD